MPSAIPIVVGIAAIVKRPRTIMYAGENMSMSCGRGDGAMLLRYSRYWTRSEKLLPELKEGDDYANCPSELSVPYVVSKFRDEVVDVFAMVYPTKSGLDTIYRVRR